MKEREINLVAFLFEILLKWRMIIVFMVIGAVLLGGYSYLQSVNDIRSAQENSDEIVEEENSISEEKENEGELTPEEKRHVEMVLEYEIYSEYCDNSLLMQIDAQNVEKAELIFGVQTDNVKNKNTIVYAYTRLLTTGMTEWLMQNGMEVEEATRIKELITIGNDNGVQGHAFEIADKGSVYVSIMHVDEKHCKELVEKVKEFVASQKFIVDSNYGAHEVTLVSENYATILDADLLIKQRAILANAISGNYNARSWIAGFSDKEKKYYEMLKGIVTSEEEAVQGEGEVLLKEPVVVEQSPSISVKYVILGMILFAFVYVFFVFVTCILNNKLRDNDNFIALYEIPQFGIISTPKEKKKFMNFVDAWIISLRDRNKRKFTTEEAKEIVAVAIKMAAKKAESKDVCFIGCDVKKHTEDICNSIKNLLEKEGIKVSVLENVLYNAEEMEKLENAKCAVLIEKTGATMYDEVTKELELLKRYNINVLGGVVVD